MSSNQQSFKPGQSYDQVDQADEWLQSNKDSANPCRDRSCAGIQTGNNEWERQGNRTATNEWNQQGNQNANFNNNEWSQQGTQTGNMNNNNNEWNQQGNRSGNNNEWNQQGRDAGNPGFLQQTGEQVLHMAQGAVDTVKNKLGMKDDK